MLKIFIAAVLICIHTAANADTRLWVTNGTTNGNIGGRAGADAFCDGDVNKPVVTDSTNRAFISVTATDEIQDMPENYGIPTTETIFQSDGVTPIATDFAALLNTGVVSLLSAPGSGGLLAWTGANADGSLGPNNCNNWTADVVVSGDAGIDNATNSAYIDAGTAGCNSIIPHLYCITYTAPVVSPSLISITPTTLTTVESGSTATYEIVLSQAPSAGETVTVNVASNDVTEGTISPASVMFTNANWDTPQTITITPGASGDGNDGDVMFNITNTVVSVGGSTDFAGILASNVGVTNQNIDGVATITVQPSSGTGLSIDEGSSIDVTVAAVGGPAAAVTIDISTDSTEITLSTPTLTLNAGNGFSTTFSITAVADGEIDADAAFTVVTAASVSADGSYNGFNPVDVVGVAVNTDGVAPEPVEEDACAVIKTSTEKNFLLCF